MSSSLPSPVPATPRPITPTEKLRILCLHGLRTNKQVMIDQTRGLRQALGDSAEFVFLNGTFESKGPTDPMIESAYPAPFYEWFEPRSADGSPLLQSDAKSWSKFRPNGETEHHEVPTWILSYKGVEQSMMRLDEEIRRHGPFDVVVGFSQGVLLLTVMTMWYLKHGKVRWWKLAISVSGGKIRGVNVRSLFEDAEGHAIPVPIPSIHIIGKRDPLNFESHLLVGAYLDEVDGFKKVVFEHDGGHRFPSASKYKDFYAELALSIKGHCRKTEKQTSSKL